ncbi:Uma2 family endonuclease [Actinomycetospora sp. CA-084318]|uniref:Uma2 family endonuclease n=1 Tax=Actinomycetospora sp. CA-084318 TaxID=3239892 RepID=UPI003D982BA4
MTIARPWPDHLLSLDEWEALDEELVKTAELVEGVLVVSPSPSPVHQRLLWRLCAALEPQVAPGHVLIPDLDVLIDAGPPPTVRKPDVAVVRAEAYERGERLVPADLLAAFEILSPGSRRTDRVAKLAEYAEGAIPHYGIVDPDGPTLTEFALVDGAYRPVAEHQGLATLAFGATLDLTTLP